MRFSMGLKGFRVSSFRVSSFRASMLAFEDLPAATGL